MTEDGWKTWPWVLPARSAPGKLGRGSSEPDYRDRRGLFRLLLLTHRLWFRLNYLRQSRLAVTPHLLDLCGRMERGLLSRIDNPSVPPLACSDMPKSQSKAPYLGSLAYPPYNREIPLHSDSTGLCDLECWVSSAPNTNERRWEFVKRYGPSHSYINRTAVEIVSHA